MKFTNTLLALTLAGGVSSCSLPSLKALPAEPDAVRPTMTPSLDRPNVQRSEPNLYARDGSVVGAQNPGTTVISPSSGQSSADSADTRWTLLEQYQAALTEKEQLQFELEAMASALEQAESREGQLAMTVNNLRETIAQSGKRVEILEGHNVELASRLTTAQIRRLQSEKLLLEAKLDWRRIQSVINTPEETSTDPMQEPLPGAPTTTPTSPNE